MWALQHRRVNSSEEPAHDWAILIDHASPAGRILAIYSPASAALVLNPRNLNHVDWNRTAAVGAAVDALHRGNSLAQCHQSLGRIQSESLP